MAQLNQAFFELLCAPDMAETDAFVVLETSVRTRSPSLFACLSSAVESNEELWLSLWDSWLAAVHFDPVSVGLVCDYACRIPAAKVRDGILSRTPPGRTLDLVLERNPAFRAILLRGAPDNFMETFVANPQPVLLSRDWFSWMTQRYPDPLRAPETVREAIARCAEWVRLGEVVGESGSLPWRMFFGVDVGDGLWDFCDELWYDLATTPMSEQMLALLGRILDSAERPNDEYHPRLRMLLGRHASGDRASAHRDGVLRPAAEVSATLASGTPVTDLGELLKTCPIEWLYELCASVENATADLAEAVGERWRRQRPLELLLYAPCDSRVFLWMSSSAKHMAPLTELLRSELGDDLTEALCLLDGWERSLTELIATVKAVRS